MCSLLWKKQKFFLSRKLAAFKQKEVRKRSNPYSLEALTHSYFKKQDLVPLETKPSGQGLKCLKFRSILRHLLPVKNQWLSIRVHQSSTLRQLAVSTFILVSLLGRTPISGWRKPELSQKTAKERKTLRNLASLDCNFSTFMTNSCNVYSFFQFFFPRKGCISASQGFTSNADTFLQQLSLNDTYFSPSFHYEVRIH